VTFSYDGKNLMSRDEPASPTEVPIVSAGGGTNPYEALRETKRIMERTTAKTKLVFLLTDGGFGSRDNDPLIQELMEQGCYISVVFLGSQNYIDYVLSNPERIQEFAHGANDFRAITNPNDLVKVAKGVVKHKIKAGLSQ
jgi:hypothetical protein